MVTYHYTLDVEYKGKKGKQDLSIWNNFNRADLKTYLDKKYPGWERARLVIWKYNDAGYNTNCQYVFIENK